MLFPRELDSNGCVICDAETVCPKCPSGKSCILTIQTCDACPTVMCKASSSITGGSQVKVGGIVGGVIGGVILVVGGLLLFYFAYYRRKVVFNRVRQKEFYFDEDAEINFHRSPQEMEKPAQRTSLATTIFTRASNIIPIAYIPGVTIAQNSRASTVTVDSYMAGDRYSRASIVGNPAQTTTAIRASPKLVSVSSDAKRNSTVISQAGLDGVPATAVNVRQLGGVKSVRVVKKKPAFGLQNELIEEEEDDDIQSVVMKNEDGDYDPFIIDDDEDAHSDQSSIRTRESRGSVLLDVEMDSRNPFDD